MSNKEAVITGKTVDLRPVTEDDAEFILSLRQREDMARCFLHKVDLSVQQEREWIRKCKELGDYNFIICGKDQEPLGMVALCNIQGTVGEVGRLASLGNPVQNIEACLLIYDFSFLKAGIERLEGTIVCDNRTVRGMQAKFGCMYDSTPHQIGEVTYNYGWLTRENYLKNRDRVAALIDKAKVLQC